MRQFSQAMSVTVIACLLSASIVQGATPTAEGKAERNGGAIAIAPAQTPGNAEMADMMRRMQTLHQQIRAAKTPAERAALMDQHLKLINEGVMTLQQLHSGSGQQTAMHVMQDRMDMMAMLMRMMVDREGMAAAPVGPPCTGTAPASPSK